MSPTDKGETAARRIGRISFALCLILFLIFVVNVLAGKAKLLFDLGTLPILSDIFEYLLLMATALSFAIAALMKERLVQEEEKRGSNHK